MLHRCRPRLLALAALLASLAPAALVPAALAQTVPSGFLLERVIGPPFADEPIGFEFLPDGRTLLLERASGNIRLAAAGAAVSSIIHTIPDILADGERGLLGVAVDPAWPSRPYLYFSYVHTDGKSVIAMLTASGELMNAASTAITLASPFVLLEAPDAAINHNGGTVRFGIDGMLYVSLGEDATVCNSQDLTTPLGKILRLRVATMPGAGPGPPPPAELMPPDNPFVAHPNEVARLVWAWGLRNPFRFDIDPETGDLYVGDPGSQTFEEINRIPGGIGGLNFAWPILEGPSPPPFMATCGEDNEFTAPMHYYPNPTKSSAAVIGGPLYRAVPVSEIALPATYDGSYFFLEWSAAWIRRLVLGTSGWEIAPPVPGQPSPDHWGEGFAFFSDFQQGPDGALYLMKHGGARGLYRIRRASPTDVSDVWPAADDRVQARPNPALAGRPLELLSPSRGYGRAELRIVTAGGRVVATLRGASSVSGVTFAWDGRDAEGTALPAGVYFLESSHQDGTRNSGRVTLLR